MTELMKRYEAETGESAIMLVCTPSNSPRLNIAKVTDEYINWLESEYAHATVEIERLNRELVEARIMNAEQRRAQ